MNVKLISNIVLTIVVVALSFWLYKIIREPIVFEREKKVRFDKTIERLKQVRTAQLAYKDAKGKFAKSFDELIKGIKYDSLTVIKAIGEVPDSLTEAQAVERGIVIRDTFYEPLLGRTFPQGNVDIDSLQYIPYSNGTKFNIDAGEIKKNNVMIQVFEVSAPEPEVLKGLNEKYIDQNHEIRVGSMTEATYTGNWE